MNTDIVVHEHQADRRKCTSHCEDNSMSEPTDVQRNVHYCLHHFEEMRQNRKRLAGVLKVAESTIGRWLTLRVEPHAAQLRNIAKLVGLNDDQFYRPHLEFVEIVEKIDQAKSIFVNYSTIERRIVLACIEKWKHQLDECYERHAGSYLMYCRSLSDPAVAAVSLVRIKEKTKHGVIFYVHNVDTRVPDRIVYRYAGVMFPVAECLAFYGEEQNLVEPFSMITSSAQVPRSSTLCGHFIAVGVAGGVRKPAGAKVALRFRSRKMIELEDERSTLGVVRVESLPSGIVELI